MQIFLNNCALLLYSAIANREKKEHLQALRIFPFKSLNSFPLFSQKNEKLNAHKL